ncbi:MAG TPA: hypothetical protein VEA40_07895 [Ramlibacter sp.]|nr:hypothetical protein [Ramlibacter sp.]
MHPTDYLTDPAMGAVVSGLAAAPLESGTQLQAFIVQIGGRRGSPRLRFEALAPDAGTCWEQHAGLAELGERVEVLTLEKALRKAESEGVAHHVLQAQQQHPWSRA